MSHSRPKSLLIPPSKQDARVNRSLSTCGNNNNSSSNNDNFDSESNELLRSLVCGEMTNLPRLSSKTVRVFISSTFSDMVYERNALMESVYPELKNFCKESYRLEFQMVDLRWGIREDAHDNHTIIDFCLKEIENCRNISIGPSFVILLGQKYGYRPFPPTINKKEFEAIKEELESCTPADHSPSQSSLPMMAQTSDVKLLDKWFKKDTNTLNHEYVLQPISSILSDYGNEENMEIKKKSEEEWETCRLKLQEMLRKGVTLCIEHKKLHQSCADKYFVSVTEYEIERGLFQVSNPSDNSLCFMRTIENLAFNSHHPRARPYLDFVSLKSDMVDKSAQALLSDLQNFKIPNALPDERNLEYFKVEWNDIENKDPVDNEEYLKAFCNVFREKMQWLINKSAQNIAKINSTPRIVEILQQFHMCKTRSEGLRGREVTLKLIREFVTSVKKPSMISKKVLLSNRPLVIYGESGCGKTSISAKVAYEVRNWFSQCQETVPIVVFRFLGTTCYSCSIRLVLGSICWQIAMAYDLETKEIPTDYPGLVFYFHEVLKKSSREKPLVLILDGLDQLSSAHRAHSLAWLPCHLPEHVKLIVSTVPNKFDILTTLKSQLTDIDRQNFIELHPLSPQLSFNLIREWLRSSQMDLTTEQFAMVQRALSTCGLPLYTSLVFEEVKRWRSYYSEDQTCLEPSIEKIINSLLDRIEMSHGHVFVSYTLSYLTASKEGLSDVELEDILSLDDHVLNDVFQHWLPPLRRIPPLLVPRLHSELSSYIIQRETNGTMVYYWYHAQFIDVARQRYLSSEPHKIYIHQILAHYFLGTWGGGNLKAYTISDKQLPWMRGICREGAEDRKVPLQPLVYGKSDKLFGHSDVTLAEKPNYNLRKLSELPFHLLESKMYVDLQNQVLFNYEWLYTKISALSLHDVLSDFTLAFQSWKDTEDLALLSSALRMSGAQVNKNPSSLAFDLIGRLLHCYIDHDKHTGIRHLLQQCDQLSLKHSCLIPLQQCFESPSSMVLFVLEGHNQVVSDLIIHEDTNELISVSKDGYLAFWDLVSGEKSRTIDVSTLNPGRMTRLFQSVDENYLIVDSDSNESPAAVFDTKTGHLLHRCGAREPTQRRAFIAGNLFCRQKSIFDLISGEEIKRVHDFVESKTYITCTITPDNKSILFDLTVDIKMFDLRGGEVIHTFQKDNYNDVSILRCTNDSSLCYCGYACSCIVVALDINTKSVTFGGKLLTIRCLEVDPMPRITPKEYNYIQEISDIKLCFNNQNMVLVEVCKSRILTYDSKNEKTTSMAKIANGDPQASFTKSSFNYNGKLVLASSENNLHIWNSNSGDHLQMIIIHSTVDFPFPWAVSKSRNIVATGSTINTAVRVWDLDKTEEREMSLLKVYKNPIDCVACAYESRLVYVKSYFGLGSSSKGYKYFDRFAIDIWNISTGNWRNFLPFNRYGRLLEMKCSPKGNYLALLLSSLSQWYVVVADVEEDKVMCAAGHDVDWACKEFELSLDWNYMASSATLDQDSEIILWNVKKNKKIVSFREAKSPLFTLDGQYLLYIDASVNIIIYSLKNFAPAKCHLQIFPDRLSTIPIKHHSILITCFKETCSEVSVWDFHGLGRIKAIMTGVSKNGFSDISKSGTLAVDDLLQVYSLSTGNIATSFMDCASDEDSRHKNLVRLTYDGLYCFWSDETSCSVKVGCIANGSLIAQANVHEKLVTMEVMDYGYVVFCGREDGHIITMKLMVPSESLKINGKNNPSYLAKSEADRRNYILDQDPCQRQVINIFDTNFQQASSHQKDSDAFTKCKEIARQLSEHAELPRLFTFLKPPSTKTSVSNSSLLVPNSPSILLFAQQNDFLSTHSLGSTEKIRAKRFFESGNTGGSHNPNSLPRKQNCAKANIRLVCSSNASLASSSTSDDESSSPVLNKVELNNRRSKSAQELFKLNKNLSKSSLDSLLSDNTENKCRGKDVEKNKNVLGRHSLKLKDEKEKKTRNKLFKLWRFNKWNK